MAEQKPVSGTFCWNELATRDTEGARKFYTELLGWTAIENDNPGMKYTVFKADDKEVAGMFSMADAEIPEEVPPHWMSYITVDDVDASIEKTKELGGELIHGPMDIPNVGRFCIIKDPSGGVISLISFPNM